MNKSICILFATMSFFLVSLLIISSIYADETREKRLNTIVNDLEKQSFSEEDIEYINKYIDMFLTWKVEENDRAYMMYIDYPYQDINDPVDYLSLTVVKFKTYNQPKIFSISCSSIIDESKGISIYFGKRISKNSQEIKMSKTKLENLRFSENNDGYLKVSFEYMKSGEINLFNEFMENDHLFVDLVNKNGEKYQIGYPLFKFKEQYRKLK